MKILRQVVFIRSCFGFFPRYFSCVWQQQRCRMLTVKKCRNQELVWLRVIEPWIGLFPRWKQCLCEHNSPTQSARRIQFSPWAAGPSVLGVRRRRCLAVLHPLYFSTLLVSPAVPLFLGGRCHFQNKSGWVWAYLLRQYDGGVSKNLEYPTHTHARRGRTSPPRTPPITPPLCLWWWPL